MTTLGSPRSLSRTGSVSDTYQDPGRLGTEDWRDSIFIAMQVKCKAGFRAGQEHENQNLQSSLPDVRLAGPVSNNGSNISSTYWDLGRTYCAKDAAISIAT